MNFADAIKICFKKYANFNGRASRSEFWYFFLFFYAGLAVVALLIFSVFDDDAFSLFFIYIFGVGMNKIHFSSIIYLKLI